MILFVFFENFFSSLNFSMQIIIITETKIFEHANHCYYLQIIFVANKILQKFRILNFFFLIQMENNDFIIL